MTNALTQIDSLLTRWVALENTRGAAINPRVANEIASRNLCEWMGVNFAGWKTLADMAQAAAQWVAETEAEIAKERAEYAFQVASMKSRTAELEAEGKCTRCGGAGILNAYVSVNGGECFECGGTGLDETI
jgi:hypothetical protein